MLLLLNRVSRLLRLGVAILASLLLRGVAVGLVGLRGWVGVRLAGGPSHSSRLSNDRSDG